jgi:Flp pilus assembly protein TadB
MMQTDILLVILLWICSPLVIVAVIVAPSALLIYVQRILRKKRSSRLPVPDSARG